MTSVSWRFEISKNIDMEDFSFANDYINATKTEVVYCLENLIYLSFQLYQIDIWRFSSFNPIKPGLF